jgi:hypothetical protein
VLVVLLQSLKSLDQARSHLAPILEQDGALDQEPTPRSQSTRPSLHLFLRIIAKKNLKEAKQAFVSQLHSSRSRIQQLQQSI